MQTSQPSGGQVTNDAARIYETQFVPALFAPWATPLADRLVRTRADRLLDVACVTGVLARELARRTAAEQVVGCDRNAGMLEVARAVAPALRWVECPAERLAFEDDQFDGVGCQFGLMFFEEAQTAIREMARVLRPSGRLVVSVWSAFPDNEGYQALTELLGRTCGPKAASYRQSCVVTHSRMHAPSQQTLPS